MTAKRLQRRKRSAVSTFMRDYQIWRMLRHFLLIALLVAYAFLGAWIFQLLELPAEHLRESKKFNDSVKRQEMLVEKLLDVHLSCGKITECRAVLEEIVWDHEESVGLVNSTSGYEWDFWNSMFYAGTIFTTVGYGHMYCQTQWGQLATILYALFGIPLVMTVLNDLGKSLFRHARKNWNRVRRVVKHIYTRLSNRQKVLHITRKPSNVSSFNENEPQANFPLLLALLLVFGYTFLCAWIFRFWETQWDYFTVFYYFFITLSTIGLGDLVPHHPRYALFGFIFVIVGLSLVSMCINIMQTHVEDKYAMAIRDLEERWDLMSELGLTDPSGEPSPNPRSPFSSFRGNHDVDPGDFFGPSLGIMHAKRRSNIDDDERRNKLRESIRAAVLRRASTNRSKQPAGLGTAENRPTAYSHYDNVAPENGEGDGKTRGNEQSLNNKGQSNCVTTAVPLEDVTEETSSLPKGLNVSFAETSGSETNCSLGESDKV